MLRRHLTHQELTLAAIDDVIDRGKTGPICGVRRWPTGACWKSRCPSARRTWPIRTPNAIISGNTAPNDTLREEKRVDGVVLCSARRNDNALAQFWARQEALVRVHRRLAAPQISGVLVADAAGAALAVRHLLRSGRRSIDQLAGPEASHNGAARRAGLSAALTEDYLPTRATPSAHRLIC
jgi:hypothetical protein